MLNKWSMFEKCWLFGFIALSIGLSIVLKDSPLNLIASLTGMLSVILVAKGRISNYYYGIVNVALVAITAYQMKFFGTAALNALYFLPMQFVGLYAWKKGSQANNEMDIEVVILTKKQKVNWLLFTVASTVVVGLGLTFVNGNMPFVDAITTILQIIAMYFMVKRFKEQWIIWVVVDVLGVVMWVLAFVNDGGSIAVLVMWIAYLFNAIYGYLNWKKAELNVNKGEVIHE